MEKAIVFFILLFSTSSVFAGNNLSQGKNQILVDDTTWRPSTRSLSEEPPLLYLYERAILINSSVTLNNIEIIISDLSGTVRYNSYILVNGSVEYFCSIANLDPGSYKVELRQGTKYLYGYFAI